MALKPRSVAIHLGGDAVDAGVARFEIGLLSVLTRRPVPPGPIMKQCLRVMIVGCLVMLFIEAILLVGGHAAPLPFWPRTSFGARYPQRIAQTK